MQVLNGIMWQTSGAELGYDSEKIVWIKMIIGLGVDGKYYYGTGYFDYEDLIRVEDIKEASRRLWTDEKYHEEDITLHKQMIEERRKVANIDPITHRLLKNS